MIQVRVIHVHLLPLCKPEPDMLEATVPADSLAGGGGYAVLGESMQERNAIVPCMPFRKCKLPHSQCLGRGCQLRHGLRIRQIHVE
eukprot:EC691662.1.p3 GENE.EC691662.1~~EC691662.1.p3  ORF type:complete len:86 (-),score=12.49 EC691662.1:270-527(-)